MLFGIVVFGVMSFGVMLLGLLSVYLFAAILLKNLPIKASDIGGWFRFLKDIEIQSKTHSRIHDILESNFWKLLSFTEIL